MNDNLMHIPALSGVYRISCVANRKVYVGSTSNVRRRLKEHRYQLGRQKHINVHLQAAWNKYGAETFVFEIIEEVELSCLLDREQYAMEQHDAVKNGFNLRPKAHSNKGIKASEATLLKLRRIAMTRRGTKRSLETCAKIGDAHRGKTISQEAREKMAAAKLGKTLSVEHRANLSKAMRARGPEYHARLSAARMGNTNSLGRIQPPDIRAKISEASLRMWNARRAAVEAGTRTSLGFPHSSEQRSKVSASLLAMNAKRRASVAQLET